jgi:cytochrome c oxidase assembly protein subunit 15
MEQPTVSSAPSSALRHFSKILCFATLFLIFLGGLVKSTESGLSVPDWPTTYGYFMFSFPLDQMVGGIKYEHTHRMVASLVGSLTLVMAIWLMRTSLPSWIKRLGIAAFLVVVGQGIFGGLTVKFFLPVWLSSLHGVLAQSFFLITIMIAYALSFERTSRGSEDSRGFDGRFIKMSIVFAGMIFIQLILGNLMRHTNSGLAVPDFPTMGGTFVPTFDQAMLGRINAWRFEHNLDPVTIGQVHLHVLHRVWAFLIFLKLLYLNSIAYDHCLQRPLVMKTMFWLNAAVLTQIMLGISTVLSMKEIYTTTFHVACGAVVLGLSFLLVLRSAPLEWQMFRQKVWVS